MLSKEEKEYYEEIIRLVKEISDELKLISEELEKYE